MISRKVTRMPGVSVTVNDDCRGCKLCTRGICFVDAIQMNGETAIIDQTRCRGCGRCVELCPLDAIDLIMDEPAFMQIAIDRISPLVDLS
jgi:Fe-S-cluster-containing hydrogenase component 2